MHQLGQVRFNTALLMARPTEILFSFTTESKLGAKEKFVPCDNQLCTVYRPATLQTTEAILTIALLTL